MEVDGEENVIESEKWTVKVLAATTFARAGETEEAQGTLGVGVQNESLEACVHPSCFPHLRNPSDCVET